ncbi:conjugal transfer protein TraB [Kitasatospora sp. NPDC059973]|uniref:conjugal transfer protein TraB n=1 Tax=Kitasatospora sp. NPDC059973 TaxID=3347020 RepID=UPI0036CB1FE1
MSDIVSYGGGEIDHGGDGGTPGFLGLAARTAKLTASALALKQGMWKLRRHMEDNADKARNLSEMCGQAGVVEQFTAQILEVSGALTRVATASGEMANAADDTETAARSFENTHRDEYGGIYEAAQASGVPMAKPGFYEVR